MMVTSTEQTAFDIPSVTSRSKPYPSTIEVQIDLMTRNNVRGWAWIPASPNTVIEVAAILRNEVIGHATAHLPRSDLGSKGYNPSPRGFAITFNRPLSDEDVIAIRASAAPTLGRDIAGDRLSCTVNESGSGSNSLKTLLNDHKRFTVPGPDFEEFDNDILAGVPSSADTNLPILLAFYLTQYHAIKENDTYWGRGFTEWRQLPKGLPRFPGHYQPRIPRDLGYYDLSYIDTMRAQVAMARAAGVGGFAFYYYRYRDRRLLEKPLDQFLDSDIEMPFVLLWANETWRGMWGDSPHTILLEQTYEAEFEEALLDDFVRHFRDRRYIRLGGGRPLLIIYNPAGVPDSRATITRWRQRLADKCGIAPLIFTVHAFGEMDPRVYACDGALEFPPHKIQDYFPDRSIRNAYSDEFSGQVINYSDFVNASLAEIDPMYPLIKTALPSWDNDARYPNRGLALTDIAPGKYEAWLKTLISRAMCKPIFGTPVVAINAWNEWAEGAYLEPDVFYGAAFLNATARAYRDAVSSR